MSITIPAGHRPRRRWVAPVIAALLVLSGCGDGDGPATEQPRREGRNDAVLDARDRTASPGDKDASGGHDAAGSGDGTAQGDGAAVTGPADGAGDAPASADPTGADEEASGTGPDEDDPSPAALPLREVGEAFVMPSENVACAMANRWAACQILERDHEPALGDIEVDTCPVGEPDTLVVTSDGLVRWVCTDESMFTHATDFGSPTLDYGDTDAFGQFQCWSQSDGVQCADSSGRGFRLARSSYDTF